MGNNGFKTNIEKDFRELAVKYLIALENGGDSSLIKKCKKVLEFKYGIHNIEELKRKLKLGIYIKRKTKELANMPNNISYEDLFQLLYSDASSNYTTY